MKTDVLITMLAQDNRTELKSARAAQRHALLLLAVAIVLIAAIVVVLLGLRSGLDDVAVRNTVLRKQAVTVALAFAGLGMAWSSSRPDAPRHWLWVLPLGVVIALTGWEMLTLGTANWQARLTGVNAFACFALITALAIVPLAALLAGLRLRAPESPVRTGAFAGLAAAGLAATVYALHCTDDSMLFLTTWYSIAAAFMAAVGAIAGARLLRW